MLLSLLELKSYRRETFQRTIYASRRLQRNQHPIATIIINNQVYSLYYIYT